MKIPYNNNQGNKSQKHFAYVEFGDEESMKLGLSSKGDVSSFLSFVRDQGSNSVFLRNYAMQVPKCQSRTKTENQGVVEDEDEEDSR